ncbi:glycosyltransferase family 39 protein [bacterium]|nr:glycosyltransferase family 39 protein [bacterium]
MGSLGADEGRYVQVARELLESRNPFHLTVHGQPYDEKPPLAFAMFAAMLGLCGGEVSPWAVRLPSVLFAWMTVLLTWDLGRRRLSPRAGLWAGWVLATAPLFLTQAPTARLDMLYAGWTLLAFWAWLARDPARPLPVRRAALFWLALLGAFFTKGPVALLIVLATVVFAAWRERRLDRARELRPLTGFFTLIAAIAAWLWLQRVWQGEAFVEHQLEEQTLDRLLHGNHEEAFYYYFPRLLFDIFFPWSLFLLAGLWTWWKRRDLRTPILSLLLFWGLAPLALFTLAADKRQMYLLPQLPALALVVGWYLDAVFLDKALHPLADRLLGWGLAALAVAGAVAYPFLDTSFPGRETWSDVVVFYAGMAALAGAGMVSVRRATGGAEFARRLLATMLVLGMLNHLWVNPMLNPRRGSRQFSRQIETLLSEHNLPMRVGGIDNGAKPEYHVHGRYRVVPVLDRPEALEGAPEVLVLREKTWQALEAAARARGYRPAWRATVSSDPLVVAVRAH